MKKLILHLGLSLITLSAFCADVEISAIERKIEQALYRADAALLDEAQSELATAFKAEPGAPARLYLQGFAAYTQATFGYVKKDMKVVQTGLESAEELLKKVKGQPWEAEALGLRGLIAGHLIGVRGKASMMTLGPKIGKLTGEAYEKAPANARVLMFHGVTLLNTPSMFGGDIDEALRLFQRAIAAFEKKEKTARGLHWGHAEAVSWLAQAKMKKGDLAGARAAAEQALVIEPDYKMIRFRLLPAIEKKAGNQDEKKSTS